MREMEGMYAILIQKAWESRCDMMWHHAIQLQLQYFWQKIFVLEMYLVFNAFVGGKLKASLDYYMDVSENSGTPQIIHFNRVFH